MSIKHSTITVDTAAKSLLTGVTDEPRLQQDDVVMSVVLSNEGAVAVRIGGPGVTAADYGYSLPAGDIVSLDLTKNDIPYAVVASGSSAVVRVLHLGVGK